MKSSEFKKQLIIGIAGVFTSILVPVLLLTLLPDLDRWIVFAVMAIFASSVFGFLFYIFGGIKAGLLGGKIGFGLVAFFVALSELPPWAAIALLIAAAFYLFLMPIIKDYRVDREKSSGMVISGKIAQELAVEDEIVKQMETEEDEVKKSIQFGEKSIVAISTTDGFYQVVKSKDQFYFVRIGNSLSGIDHDLLITDFDDESVFATKKKDFIIPITDIKQINIRFRRALGSQVHFTVRLSIVTDTKKINFNIPDILSKEILEDFFAGIKLHVRTEKIREIPRKVLTDEETAILPTLKIITLWLYIIGLSATFVFFVYPVIGIVYRILSSLCILIPAITFFLYIRFNNVILLADRDGNDSTFRKNSTNVLIPLLLPPMALAVRSLSDFVIVDWRMLLVWSVLLFAIILFVFLRYTKEYKKMKSIIILIVIAAIAFAPAAAVQINCLYDYSTPPSAATTLIDKYISEGEYGTDYMFTVQFMDGTRKDLPVNKNYYEHHEKGAGVPVIEKPGVLGIAFAYIDE
ncbi:MAG: hypothetical protein ACYC5K_01895 [Saccharofermentanales bacterium]